MSDDEGSSDKRTALNISEDEPFEWSEKNNANFYQNLSRIKPITKLTFYAFMLLLIAILVVPQLLKLVEEHLQAEPSCPISSRGCEDLMNLYSDRFAFDLFAYASQNQTDFEDNDQLIWTEKGLIYGDRKSFSFRTDILIPESVQRNGSLYLHLYLTKSGYPPTPRKVELSTAIFVVHKMRRLNQYRRSKVADDRRPNRSDDKFHSYWHPNVTINLVYDLRTQCNFKLHGHTTCEFITGRYRPIVFFDDSDNLIRDYRPINQTTKRLPIQLALNTASFEQFQRYLSYQGAKQRVDFGVWFSRLNLRLRETEEEEDFFRMKLKELEAKYSSLQIVFFVRLNFVFVGLFYILTLVDIVNDIIFWCNRVYLSDTLSFHYLAFTILSSIATLDLFGLVFEGWKMQTAIELLKKDVGYHRSLTKRYDRLALKLFICFVFLPLFIVYLVYCIVFGLFTRHDAWYWVLIYDFFLYFGPIAFLFQLIVNYRFKLFLLPWCRLLVVFKFARLLVSQLGFFIFLYNFDLLRFTLDNYPLYLISCLLVDLLMLAYAYQYRVYYTKPL